MSINGSRLLPSGLLAGVVFAAGLFSVFILPGGGGVTDRQFLDFYGSAGRRSAALLLFFALVAGSWLMAWFYSELRRTLPPGALGDYAERLAWVGASATVIGGAVALGPVGVQLNSANDFVGIPIAHTFDQAGLFILIVGGIYSFALAMFLLSWHARRTAAAPRWQTATGIVVAVLLLGSYVAAPAILLPLWAIGVGVSSRRAPAAAAAIGASA